MSAMQQKSGFKEMIQEAALGFLQRHEPEHLGNNQVLFTRAVDVLTRAYSANQAEAENAVARAYGELRNQGEHRQLDLTTSNSQTAVVTDPASGLSYAVPVSEICKRLIDTPERRRLRLVDHN